MGLLAKLFYFYADVLTTGELSDIFRAAGYSPDHLDAVTFAERQLTIRGY
jgi:hypothetical protein